MTYQLTKFADAPRWSRTSAGSPASPTPSSTWTAGASGATTPCTRTSCRPTARRGGVGGLSDMARRVKDLGYLFGLHDQYIDYYFHAPSYNEANSIVMDNGKPVRINSWCGGPCGHLCYTHIPARSCRRNYYEGIRRSTR